MEETYTKHKKQEGSGGEKEKREYHEFDVGPIYHHDEAAMKANAWVKENKPGEGWVWNGHWKSITIDGRRTSVAGFTRKQPLGRFYHPIGIFGFFMFFCFASSIFIMKRNSLSRK